MTDSSPLEQQQSPEVQSKPKHGFKISRTAMVSFTFLNSCFGSGLLAIPQIAVKIGIFWFLLYNIVAALFSSFCFYYIIKEQINRKCHQKTLTMMISAHFGKNWIVLLDLAIIFCLLPVSYIAVAAGCIADAFNQWFGWSFLEDFWPLVGMKLIIGFCVMYPLTLMKNIKILNYVSSLCIVFVFVTVAFVLIEFFIFCATGDVMGKPHKWPTPPIWPHDNDYANVFTYICMFLSLYSMHATIPCLMREYVFDFGDSVEFIEKSVKKAVFGITVPTAFLTYTGFGLIGAFMFDYSCTDEEKQNGCFAVNSNILLAFSGSQTATVIELLFSIVVFICFPCMLYPIRKSIINFFKIDADVNTKKGYFRYNMIGLAVTCICLIICCFLTAIDQIQSFTANLLGIVLYGLSGIMLWYKHDRKPTYSNAKYQVEDNKTEEGEKLLDNENNEQVDDGKIDPPLTKQRTAIFWTATVFLLALNVLALGSQIYSWTE